MKKYDSYKHSDIEWIREIPNHWKIKKFGHLFSFSRGLGITKQDLKDEGIPCVNYGDIHSKYGFSVNPEIHKLKCVDELYLEAADKSLLSRGDFVFADTSEDIEGSGNYTVLDSDLPTFAGYHTIIARHESGNDYKYLAYYFNSLEFRNQIRSSVSGVKVYSITQEILKNSVILLPPLSEQTAIATYLDRKTAEIDELIADKKRLPRKNRHHQSGRYQRYQS
jgi:type I restriction enzyme S subunit